VIALAPRRDRGHITSARIVIDYPDGPPDDRTKEQIWNRAFLDETSALIFHANFMGKADIKRLNASRDWRRNHCFLRYRRDSRVPQPICERGRSAKRRPLRRFISRRVLQRGVPDVLELTISHRGDAPLVVTCDRIWLAETAGLIFLPLSPNPAQEAQLFPNPDWRLYPVLIRLLADGSGEGLIPWGGSPPVDRASVSEDQCGYPPLLRPIRT